MSRKDCYIQLTTEKVYSLYDVSDYFWSINIVVIKQTNLPFCQGMIVLLTSNALIIPCGYRTGSFLCFGTAVSDHDVFLGWGEEGDSVSYFGLHCLFPGHFEKYDIAKKNART